jgi:hypothetical protein
VPAAPGRGGGDSGRQAGCASQANCRLGGGTDDGRSNAATAAGQKAACASRTPAPHVARPCTEGAHPVPAAAAELLLRYETAPEPLLGLAWRSQPSPRRVPAPAPAAAPPDVLAAAASAAALPSASASSPASDPAATPRSRSYRRRWRRCSASREDRSCCSCRSAKRLRYRRSSSMLLSTASPAQPPPAAADGRPAEGAAPRLALGGRRHVLARPSACHCCCCCCCCGGGAQQRSENAPLPRTDAPPPQLRLAPPWAARGSPFSRPRR